MTPWGGSLFATAGGGGGVPFASRSRGRRFCLHGGVTGPPSELALAPRVLGAISSLSMEETTRTRAAAACRRCEWASHGWPSAPAAVGLARRVAEQLLDKVLGGGDAAPARLVERGAAAQRLVRRREGEAAGTRT